MTVVHRCWTCLHSSLPVTVAPGRVCTRYRIGTGAAGQPLHPVDTYCYTSANLCCGGVGWQSAAIAPARHAA